MEAESATARVGAVSGVLVALLVVAPYLLGPPAAVGAYYAPGPVGPPVVAVFALIGSLLLVAARRGRTDAARAAGAVVVLGAVVTLFTLTWALAVLPLLPAIAVFAAFIKFLRETDEMVRRVHMNGLAVGFAAGAFVVMGIQPPAVADGTTFDKELVFAAMAVGMSVGTIWSARRYR